MVGDAYSRVVEYLEKQGPANTFKLASDLGIDRDKILNVIEKLSEEQAIEFRFGIVQLLKLPEKREPVRPKKTKKVEHKAKARKTPLKEVLEERIRDLENIQENLRDENKGLRKRLSELETETGIEKQPKQPKVKRHPRIKRRPKIKRRVKKRAEKRPCKEIPRHMHRVRKLKRGVKKLKQKANTVKNIIKKIPAEFRKKSRKRKKAK